MKAILLNSADKLAFVHNAERTLFNLNGQRWDQTTAHSSFSDPLDLHMGAGHLNVSNALTNYEPGEYGPGNVPLLGWDYSDDEIGGPGGYVDYVFEEAVSGWVAVTLAWDRLVELTNPDNTYSSGDEFFNQPIEDELTNLDLYLMPANSNNVNDAIYRSTAQADSVEHIFWEIETEGEYKIRVRNSGGGDGYGSDFGIAWWAGEVFPPTPGDFDEDGDVDGDDLSQWRGDFGTNGDSDADDDGDSDLADLMAWQRNYTGSQPLMSRAVEVPEPATLVLWAWLTAGVFLRSRCSR